MTLVLRTDLRGIRGCSRIGCLKHRLILSWTFAPLQSLTHGRPPREAASLMRFLSPLTHQVSSSDQHRVCLARLCCAYGLSQPPGALFRPTPFRLCFTPVAPVGFSLQRFSLPCGRSNLSADLPLLTLSGSLIEAPRLRLSSASGRRPSSRIPRRSDVDPVRSGARSSGPEMPSRRRVIPPGFHRHLAVPAVAGRRLPPQTLVLCPDDTFVTPSAVRSAGKPTSLATDDPVWHLHKWTLERRARSAFDDGGLTA